MRHGSIKLLIWHIHRISHGGEHSTSFGCQVICRLGGVSQNLSSVTNEIFCYKLLKSLLLIGYQQICHWVSSFVIEKSLCETGLLGVFHETCHQWQMKVFVISYWNPCFWLVISGFVTDFCHLSLRKVFVKRVPGLSAQSRWGESGRISAAWSRMCHDQL